ncbi:MAG: hypothetical protein GKC03_02800 [Methanomassiliicoccales archaeon]|nr:hypothetical protein [Methanomassiliicoccales archaeon]NYT14517.1 hypothetical protein [Methanomassiliicoccales archaeon]
MDIQVLIYDKFCDFEVTVALSWMNKQNIVTIGLEDRKFISESKFTVTPDLTISEAIPGDADLLIIPGGTPGKYIKSIDGENVELLFHHIRSLDRKGKLLGAICGGPEFLALAGVLKGKRITHGLDDQSHPSFDGAIYVDEPLVVDGNIITAKGNAFIEFGLVLMDLLDLFESEEERQNDIDWLLQSGNLGISSRPHTVGDRD